MRSNAASSSSLALKSRETCHSRALVMFHLSDEQGWRRRWSTPRRTPSSRPSGRRLMGNRGCANLAVTSLGNFVSARLATAHSWNPPRLRYFKQFSYHLASEGVLYGNARLRLVGWVAHPAFLLASMRHPCSLSFSRSGSVPYPLSAIILRLSAVSNIFVDGDNNNVTYCHCQHFVLGLRTRRKIGLARRRNPPI